MQSAQNDQPRYITATQDDKGKNLTKVKEWHKKGLLTDYKVADGKIKISFRNRDNV